MGQWRYEPDRDDGCLVFNDDTLITNFPDEELAKEYVDFKNQVQQDHDDKLSSSERATLVRVLAMTDGHGKAARKLGISRWTLKRKMQKHGITGGRDGIQLRR